MRKKHEHRIIYSNNYFVAKCPELDFISQGKTREEAKKNLLEVIEIQFEEMSEMGTLDEYLAECGYQKTDERFIQHIEMIGFEKYVVQVTAAMGADQDRMTLI